MSRPSRYMLAAMVDAISLAAFPSAALAGQVAVLVDPVGGEASADDTARLVRGGELAIRTYRLANG